MRILNFRELLKKINLKNDTKKKFQLQRLHNYPIYPRGSKIFSDKVFANIDDGKMCGSHWTTFYVEIK